MRLSIFLMRVSILLGNKSADPATKPLGTGNSGNTLQELLKLIGLIVVFALIIIACYWVTRFVGTRQLGKTGKSNFKVLDVHKLGMNQSLAIVKIGSRYFCLAFSKDHVDTVCELLEEDFEHGKGSDGQVKSFGDVFSSILKKKNDEGMPASETKPENKEEQL